MAETPFSKLLTEYIGFKTLDEISKACAARGFKLDPSYLSRLRSGTRPAPDDDALVWALAQICEKPGEPLLFLAHLERNPRVALYAILDLTLKVQSAREALEDLADQTRRAEEDLRREESSADTDETTLNGKREELAEAKRLTRIVSSQLTEDEGLLNRFIELAEIDLKPPSPLSHIDTANVVRTEAEIISELAQATGISEKSLTLAVAALKSLQDSVVPKPGGDPNAKTQK